MELEYLQEFNKLPKSRKTEALLTRFQARHDLCRKYSFAIPNKKAVSAIKALSPLIELGAGSGYWAKLLKASGAEIQAYDKAPPNHTKKNKYNFTQSHLEIEMGTESVLESADPKTNLFLCWPNYQNNFASNCLLNFKGSYFAYIGESRGGCTGDDKFFDILETQWTEIENIEIPQWEGIHDRLTIHKRNK